MLWKSVVLGKAPTVCCADSCPCEIEVSRLRPSVIVRTDADVRGVELEDIARYAVLPLPLDIGVEITCIGLVDACNPIIVS